MSVGDSSCGWGWGGRQDHIRSEVGLEGQGRVVERYSVASMRMSDRDQVGI